MSTNEKPKVKVIAPVENSNLQAAVKQSVILPTDASAKANTIQIAHDPAPNIAALQKATQQSASLPQNRIMVRESVEKTSDKS